ncbi:hypothetical protein M9Y09_18755 [Clostridioides difficile]|nr:hypothetical protein [Clostridioides difficile]
MTESESFDYLDAPVKSICGTDVPIPYNPALEKEVVPRDDEIEEAIKSLIVR